MSEQKRNDTLYTCDNCGEAHGTTKPLCPDGWSYLSVYGAASSLRMPMHACSGSCLISLLLTMAATIDLPAPDPSSEGPAADLVEQARQRLGLDSQGHQLTAAEQYAENERREAAKRRGL